MQEQDQEASLPHLPSGLGHAELSKRKSEREGDGWTKERFCKEEGGERMWRKRDKDKAWGKRERPRTRGWNPEESWPEQADGRGVGIPGNGTE